MTVEQPINSSHVWFVNATEAPIDIHVNYAEQPAITDVKPLSVDTEFEVKGKDDTPYGTYTFSARLKDRPGSEALAAVSVEFSVGKSFTAVFHQLPSRRHRFSVYENDFTPSDAPRMTVRHTARPEVLSWRIAPKDFKIEIPHDEREGTLHNGQWQVARNVVQNDYRFEVLLDGELVAEHPDLELEHEKDRTVYIVGDPYSTPVTGTLRRFVIEQEFKLPRGAPPPVEVTPPAEPHFTDDHNLPVLFECQGLQVLQTNSASTVVSAIDPDGVITDLAVAYVSPKADGILIPDHGVTPATAIGGRATAMVLVLDDVPPGVYEVTIVTNLKSFGPRAACTLLIEVLPITIGRIMGLVAEYEQVGAIEADTYLMLSSALELAQHKLLEGAIQLACEYLKEAVAVVASESNKGIRVAAAEHLEREIKALRENLGCG